MPIGIWALEWLNENAQRAYPLTADATRLDVSGTFLLPNDFLVGLYFPIPAGLSVIPTSFFLYKLAVSSVGIRLTVGYDNSGTTEIAATAVIAASTHTEYDSYSLLGQGTFDGSTGRIGVGSLESLLALPEGSYTFSYAGGKLEVDCIRPMLNAVRSLRVVNGDEQSSELYGVVELRAGNNIRLTVLAQTAAGATVRIDAIDGEGLADACACEDPGDAPCIRTINGIGADGNGTLTIAGDDCFTFSSINHGFAVVDNCSSPCCGCQELSAINAELRKLNQAEVTLSGFIYALQSTLMTMQSNVMSSLLHDEGCNTCDETGSSSSL